MLARIAAVVLVALAASGCGHGGSAKAPAPEKSARRSPARPAATPRDREPRGKLSAAEYRAIVRSYTLLKPLQSSDANPQTLRRARAACGPGVHPNTRLMAFVRDDCLNAIAFFKGFQAIEQATTICAQGAAPVRDRCFAGRYDRFGSAVRAIVTNGLAMNKELARRGIRGLCADSIGIPRSQVVSMTGAAVAADAASRAALQQDDSAFLRAQNLLARALARQAPGDPLAGIVHGCPHEGAEAPKRAAPKRKAPAPGPAARKKRAPRPSKPRIPQPGDGIKA